VVARRRIQEGRWQSIDSVHPAVDRGWPRDMAADPGRQHVPAVDPGHQHLPAADRTPPGLGDTTKGWLSGSLALHAATAYLCHHRRHPPPHWSFPCRFPLPSVALSPRSADTSPLRLVLRYAPPSLLLLLPLFPLPLLRARAEIVGRVVMVYCNTSLMCKHDTCRGNLCYYTCHVKAQHITTLIAIDL
jgi:hypothetical protein